VKLFEVNVESNEVEVSFDLGIAKWTWKVEFLELPF
jgi:hypothetical protein